jgi:hypothetical protein
MAEEQKQRNIKEGKSATEAHSDAAEYVIKAIRDTLCGRRSKWHMSVETLAREMQGPRSNEQGRVPAKA